MPNWLNILSFYTKASTNLVEQMASIQHLKKKPYWHSTQVQQKSINSHCTWASDPSASNTLLMKMIGIQMTDTMASIQPTPMAQDG